VRVELGVRKEREGDTEVVSGEDVRQGDDESLSEMTRDDKVGGDRDPYDPCR